MNLEEWQVWGTQMEDVMFYHKPCGYSLYVDGIDQTLASIMEQVEEHSKECKK